LDGLKIFDHAHAILGSITLIQVDEIVAGEAPATEAVFDLSHRHLPASLDFAYDAGFRFETVVFPAAGAAVFIPCVCAAQAAVHAAGCDQVCGNCMCQY